jgi:serine/threonine protein kinase
MAVDPAQGRELGDYRLVRRIAAGGMAEIWLARVRGVAGFEKYVALKTIRPNLSEDDRFIEMLIEEAKLTVQLQHANIVQTFDLGHVDDTYYITMEYVDGADLYQILRALSIAGRSMPVAAVAYVGKEIGAALDHAHTRRDAAGRPLGIIHRDISPQNVLLGRAGEVKVGDFGIAKAAQRVTQTAAGVIKGKYHYMSPEQAWGQPLDARADVFSTGVVLYEMLIGQMLHLEADMDVLLEKVRTADIPRLGIRRPDAPAELEAIVMRAVERDPARRFQSALEMTQALERFLIGFQPDFGGPRLARLVGETLTSGRAPSASPSASASASPSASPSATIDDDATELRSGAEVLHGRGATAQIADTPLPPVEVRSEKPLTARTLQLDVSDLILVPDALMSRDEFRSTETSVLRLDTPAPAARSRDQQTARAEGLPDVSTPTTPVGLPAAPVGTLSDDHTHVATPHARIATPTESVDDLTATIPQRRSPYYDEPPMPMPRSSQLAVPVASPAEGANPMRRLAAGSRLPQGVSAPIAVPPLAAGTPAGTEPTGYAAPGTPSAPTTLPQPGFPWSPPPAALQFGAAEAPSVRPRVGRKILVGLGLLAALTGLTVLVVWLASSRGASGTILVSSSVPGATVSLDGKDLGAQVPAEIDNVALGTTHALTVNAPGYVSWSDTVTLTRENPEVAVTAALHPALGQLIIQSEPNPADVYVDGQLAGRTPLTVPAVEMDRDVTIEVRKRGYVGVERTFSWNGKDVITADFPLDRAP